MTSNPLNKKSLIHEIYTLKIINSTLLEWRWAILIIESSHPVIANWESIEITKDRIAFWWYRASRDTLFGPPLVGPPYFCKILADLGSQTLVQPSSPQVIINLPSGENFPIVTGNPWEANTWRHCPEGKLQSQHVPSSEPHKTTGPLGCHSSH